MELIFLNSEMPKAIQSLFFVFEINVYSDKNISSFPPL